MNSYGQLPKPFFVLAPMDDVTDSVFRRIVQDLAAPDLFFTEFVNVDGLQSPGRDRLLKKLRFTAGEKNLVAQLWGLNPDNFRKTAEQIADGTFAREFDLPEGVNFVGIDLNMGCPAKSEVKSGACSALIKNPELALKIIKATQEGAGHLPVSVKTRLGFNEVDFSWHELLLQQKLSMLTVHGRTRKEMSKVPARWDDINTVRELRDKIAPQTLIVGNGDVVSRVQGEALAQKHHLDGIMIGRGVFQDPYVFAANSPWTNTARDERIALYAKHVKLFVDTWQGKERPIAVLNRFCKIYINGFDGAKELREKLMAAESAEELLTLLHAA
ncbi:MAG TPA: tRNA-dihydrouridine synthase [Candidatus Saccharimonadales bacterium]